MVDLSLAAPLNARSRRNASQRVESRTDARLVAEGATEVDAAALQRIGIAFTAITATVTAVAFIAVISN